LPQRRLFRRYGITQVLPRSKALNWQQISDFPSCDVR
jgi:hypothetical protein